VAHHFLEVVLEVCFQEVEAYFQVEVLVVYFQEVVAVYLDLQID
jgi:hypothetical protein